MHATLCSFFYFVFSLHSITSVAEKYGRERLIDISSTLSFNRAIRTVENFEFLYGYIKRNDRNNREILIVP